MSRLDKDIMLTLLLVLLAVGLAYFNFKPMEPIEPPTNVVYDTETNTLFLNSMTLEQKIAQMLVIYGNDNYVEEYQNMLIGGLYLGAKPEKDDFIEVIEKFQEKAVIPFLITVDLEGCRNPFENFKKFPPFKEIDTEEKAYMAGYEEGRLLSELGFDMNFAPVVDLNDSIWECRSFNGSAEEVGLMATHYIAGLQANRVLAVAKHYPGRTLETKDPHEEIALATISEDDLLPFEKVIEEKVDAVMVSHLIVDGLVDSEKKPSVVSKKVTGELRNKFTGLIISDEIGMLGLREYYTNGTGWINYKQMFTDVFNTENDLILTFDSNPERLYNDLILTMVKAVEEGEISEEKIDNSVIRILKAKGIKVAR